jgi:hypothetical protein
MVGGILLSAAADELVRPGSMPETESYKGRGPSTAHEGRQSIRIPVEGLPARSVKDWYRVFEPYENLATNKEIAARALHFGQRHEQLYDEKTYDLNQKWQLQWALYQGRSLLGYADGDLTATHVPEYWKMVETLVPRLEEPFTSHDPSFEVKGRDRMDRQRAHKLRAFLQWQHAENNLEQLLVDVDRVALIYGFAVVKSWWSVETDYHVHRNPRRVFSPDGEETWQFDVEEKEEITYEGPRWMIVDNPWFMIDTYYSDPQKSRLVGDKRYMTFDEIAELGEREVFANWKGLEKEPPMQDRRYSDYARDTRALTWPWDVPPAAREPDGTPPHYPVSEFWCKFQIRPNERARECVLTIANGTRLLRVQENPYDDKHRPYSIWKACPHPFEFHTMGPLDHLIPLAMELDRNRRIFSKSVEINGCPIIIADEQQDLPTNLWHVRPGEVLNANPDRIRELNVTSDVRGLQAHQEILRRDFEEASGAPRVYEGTQSGSAGATATEIERKIQEGNKRLAALIRGKGRMLGQLYQQQHALNRQYMRARMPFRVLGRGAIGLDEYETITPEEVNHAVDFEFIGLRTMKSLGIEAIALTNFSQLAQSILTLQPELIQNVDALGLLRFALDATIGHVPGEEIIRVPEELDSMTSQVEEDRILLGGEYVSVHPMDNDEQHMDRMELVMQHPDWERLDDARQAVYLRHYLEHELQEQKKGMRRSASSQMTPQLATPTTPEGPPAMGAPGQGSPPSGPTVPYESPQGETPGPPNAARMRTPGRKMTPFQTERLAG